MNMHRGSAGVAASRTDLQVIAARAVAPNSVAPTEAVTSDTTAKAISSFISFVPSSTKHTLLITSNGADRMFRRLQHPSGLGLDTGWAASIPTLGHYDAIRLIF